MTLVATARTRTPVLVPFGAVTADTISDPGSSVMGDAERLISFVLIAPSSPAERPGPACSRWLAIVARTPDASDVARRTLLNTSYGLGEYTLAEAEAAFRSAADVSVLVEQVAGGRAPAVGAIQADEAYGSRYV